MQDVVAQTLNSASGSLDPWTGNYKAKGCRGNGCLMFFDFSIVYGQYCPGPPVCNPAARGEISDIHLENIQVNGNGSKFILSSNCL